MSLKSKVLLAVTVVAVVGAAVALAVILTPGRNDANSPDDTDLPALIAALPDKDALDEMHSVFSGYWTSGDLFAGFISIDGVPGIDYGLSQTSFGAGGKITDARAVSAHETSLTILIPAVPTTEMDDAKPERAETVCIDVSNYSDNRLNIRIEGLGGGEWHTYEYGGGSLEDAFK